mmetsp:Transcript_8631/g.17943  ORF Transcript_8631/g.17943 Transcript_8631/m.17943 type:complete len:320 (-) Transcript_8631:1197-2156(-)
MVNIGTLFNQRQGKFFIFHHDGIKQQVVFSFGFLIQVDNIGIRTGFDQGHRHFTIISLNGHGQGRSTFGIYQERIGSGGQQGLHTGQMSPLRRHMQGRDIIHVTFLIRWCGTGFDGLFHLGQIFGSGLGSRIDKGSQFDKVIDTFRVSTSGGKHDGCSTRKGHAIQFRIPFASLLQGFHHEFLSFQYTLRSNAHDGRNTIVILVIKIGSGIHENLHGFHGTTRGRFQKRGTTSQVRLIDTGLALFQQEFHHFILLIGGGVHECRHAGIGMRRGHIGTVIQQNTHGFGIAVSTRNNEGVKARGGHEIDMIGSFILRNGSQ